LKGRYINSIDRKDYAEEPYKLALDYVNTLTAYADLTRHEFDMRSGV